MADTDISKQEPTAGPSGATDKLPEREKKFDEEGGDQPQARSQTAVEEELERVTTEEPPEGMNGRSPKRTH